jgi:phage FluMu protein Com
MAELFLSYAHEDVGSAETLAELLEANGLTVWWDRRMVPGDNIRAVIVKQIENAKAVIVLWSRTSVESNWVLGEADKAHELDKLVPIKIEECELPINYRAIHSPEIYKKNELPKFAQILTDKFKTSQPTQGTVRRPATRIEFTDKSASNFFTKLKTQRTQLVKEREELQKAHKEETVASNLRLLRKYPLFWATSFIGWAILPVLVGSILGYLRYGNLPATIGMFFLFSALIFVVFFCLPPIEKLQSWFSGKKTTTVASVTIPCPHCKTLNRVPSERSHDQSARCGKCHQSLFPAHA